MGECWSWGGMECPECGELVEGIVWFDDTFFCHVVAGSAVACPFREPCSRQRLGLRSRCLRGLQGAKPGFFGPWQEAKKLRKNAFEIALWEYSHVPLL